MDAQYGPEALASQAALGWRLPRPLPATAASQEGFGFTFDRSPAVQQDRLLHAWIGYQVSQITLALTDKPWLGLAAGVAIQIPKEIIDGASSARDFDFGDLLAAGLGAGIPWVRHELPILEPLSFKIWYWPSDEFRNRPPGTDPSITADYAGQRFFLTYAPGRVREKPDPWPNIPPWLGFAIGHGVSVLVSRLL